jgi:adenylylsulfate kinase
MSEKKNIFRFRINYNKLSKSIVYRFVSSLITFTISYLVTRNVKVGLSIGSLDLIFKIINYYTFDSVWESIFRKKIKPCVIWLTGLSGSGKSTIASELVKNFEKNNVPYVLLDGDQIRKVIKETGYDFFSRRKHNLNVAYMASLFERQGNVVVVSLISPYKEVRNECRAICKNFIEVFVNTPLEICEERDVKGLYKKARSGEIENFTGVSSPYEESTEREITIHTTLQTVETSAKIIFNYIKSKKRKLRSGKVAVFFF